MLPELLLDGPGEVLYTAMSHRPQHQAILAHNLVPVHAGFMPVSARELALPLWHRASSMTLYR